MAINNVSPARAAAATVTGTTHAKPSAPQQDPIEAALAKMRESMERRAAELKAELEDGIRAAEGEAQDLISRVEAWRTAQVGDLLANFRARCLGEPIPGFGATETAALSLLEGVESLAVVRPTAPPPAAPQGPSSVAATAAPATDAGEDGGDDGDGDWDDVSLPEGAEVADPADAEPPGALDDFVGKYPLTARAARALPLVLVGGISVPSVVEKMRRAFGDGFEWKVATHSGRAQAAVSEKMQRSVRQKRYAGLIISNNWLGVSHATPLGAACRSTGQPHAHTAKVGAAELHAALATIEKYWQAHPMDLPASAG